MRKQLLLAISIAIFGAVNLHAQSSSDSKRVDCYASAGVYSYLTTYCDSLAPLPGIDPGDDSQTVLWTRVMGKGTVDFPDKYNSSVSGLLPGEYGIFVMTVTSGECIEYSPATTMQRDRAVVPPSVSLSANTNSNAICEGFTLTFTAYPTGGDPAKRTFEFIDADADTILQAASSNNAYSTVAKRDIKLRVHMKANSACVPAYKDTVNSSVVAVKVSKMPEWLEFINPINYNDTICNDQIKLILHPVTNGHIKWTVWPKATFSSDTGTSTMMSNLVEGTTYSIMVSNISIDEDGYSHCPVMGINRSITRAAICSGANDLPINATALTSSSLGTAQASDYIRGRNSVSTCTTSEINDNVIDAYYTFIASDATVSFDVNVDNPAWQSAMELVDTTTGNSLSNQCVNTVFSGQSDRIYTFTGLIIGQKYEIRLELGGTSPLGHARLEAAGNGFSVKMASTTGINDESFTVNNKKEIFAIYNIQGQEVSKTYAGLVIYKFTDGTTQKVIQE